MKLLLLSALVLTVCAKFDYTGYKLISVTPKHIYDERLIEDFQDEEMAMVLSSYKIGKRTDLLVAPAQWEHVLARLQDQKLAYDVKTDNFQTMLDIEESSLTPNQFNLNSYNRFSVIEGWLQEVSGSCGSRCSLQSIGTSYEGRNLWVMKVGIDTGTTKPKIYIECGVHAREWIAPATCLNIINKFVTGTSDTEVNNLLTWYDWYIEPTSNPDGYEYTHTNNRMWRKTRKPNPGSACFGTDPNRNFGHEWGGAGTSGDPCSDIFRGTNAFSEVETARIRDFITPIASEFRAYMAVHSYGQYMLCPWSYTTALPPNYDDLERVADLGCAAANAVDGQTYVGGHSAILLGATAGSSDDWAYSLGIAFAYTAELRDTGTFGFSLPERFIDVQLRELWAAIVAMATDLNTNYPMP